jgi:hypothetical protein
MAAGAGAVLGRAEENPRLRFGKRQRPQFPCGAIFEV